MQYNTPTFLAASAASKAALGKLTAVLPPSLPPACARYHFRSASSWHVTRGRPQENVTSRCGTVCSKQAPIHTQSNCQGDVAAVANVIRRPALLPVPSITSQALSAPQRVAIDLEFDGLMSQNELRSLVQQLSYAYSAAVSGAAQLHLHLLGVRPSSELDALLAQQMPGHVNWAATRSSKGVAEFFKVRCGMWLLQQASQSYKCQQALACSGLAWPCTQLIMPAPSAAAAAGS